MKKIAKKKTQADENIYIKGAKLHNLKNIDVEIPRNKLVVITGLSGSGKSTLAFDTLYAEGQRRYVESLSSYARQFLGKLDKPMVDSIKGIAPAIAIEQKVNSTNPRSTVGTSTEIYEYIKLLFARIGTTYSPISGNPVQKDDVTTVVNYLQQLDEGIKIMVLAPYILVNRTLKEQLELFQQIGFSRILINNTLYILDEVDLVEHQNITQFSIVIDRVKIKKNDEDFWTRMGDSIQTAFYEGNGVCLIQDMDTNISHEFSNKLSLDGIDFIEPTLHLFSFNNPYGACPQCEGYGSIIGIDEDLVVPNKALSIYEDAVSCWKGEKASDWKRALISVAEKMNFPIHKPYHQLTKEQKKDLWRGNKYFEGIDGFFAQLQEKIYKIQNRVMLSRYRGRTTCPSCQGTRLNEQSSYVKINQKSIQQLIDLPIIQLKEFFDSIQLTEYQTKVAKRILLEIQNRIQFLLDVGLSYLTLNRPSNTLSGGESQRINLATSLGSSLVGSMYILDEPSIGLHSRDTDQLIGVLKKLRDLGNTVIVVEHDEEVIRAADYIIDIGPEAGVNGGELIAAGSYENIQHIPTLTTEYLKGTKEISRPKQLRKLTNYVEAKGVRENNLKNFDIKIPLGGLIVLTGVSGSGKSTLLKKIIYPAIAQNLGINVGRAGDFDGLSGRLDLIKHIEYIDQNPIGKSSRSNPATYTKVYDDIRAILAKQKLAQINNLTPSHFSFNVDGGRCESCKGEGQIVIEMQFMADVYLECEACKGKKFKEEILEVNFQGKNIADILSLTIDEAVAFFSINDQKIAKKLLPLQEVGLGYLQLGQSSNTLSGGEAQRVKLASFLGKAIKNNETLFIFDEPSTGLHFHDINKLLTSFQALIEKGHTICVIEHAMDIIKCADWIIDLGPDGGDKGGFLVAEGSPEEVANNPYSITGGFLKNYL